MFFKNIYRWHILRIALGIAVLAIILLVSGVGAAPFDNNKIEFFHGKEAAASEVLVKFRAATPQAINQTEIEEDVDEAEYVGSAQILRFHSRSKNVTTLISELSARADVEYAEPNYIIHAISTPNDPYFNQLWGMQNTGQSIQGVPGTPGADINATSAWDISTGSKANVVAVIDTGIDYTHSDLAANIWSAPNAFTVTVGGRSITCQAGSHGFNAIKNTCDPKDDNNHGTHVSGTIGAVGNNSLGVVGVNWNTSIMGAKFLNARGSGYTSDAINAIDFAIQTKALFGGATGSANVRVLSNSWGGGGFSQALLDEINKANANDMLFVAAAGNSASNNDATPFYPANFNAPNVVAVAATDNKDSLASFSNYGPTTVDLGAPGVSVLSTIIGGNYDYYSGTSMATPHVSGAAILILSKCALNTADLKANILNNVDPIPSLSGITVTGGRLNVNKSIHACSAPVISPSPVITSWINTKTNNNSLTLSINTDEAIRFYVLANQTIDTWNWSRDGAIQSSNLTHFDTSWSTAGYHYVSVNGTNANGTTQTITWNVTVQAPSYVPPAPVNLTSTQGNFWINYTWEAGTGNVTDGYIVNVNGTWINGTSSLTYTNGTILPHGWRNITVIALNNSGGYTSPPVSNNTQVTNNIPILESIDDKTVPVGQYLNFTVQASDVDSDTLTYGTNATWGTLDTATGNFSWLPGSEDVGVHIWEFNASDGYGGEDARTVIVTVNNAPLSIISSSPAEDPGTILGAAQTFEVMLNRTADVTWYVDGVQAQTDTGVTSSSYTNSTASAGVHNVNATASDGVESVSREWTWTVSASVTSVPTISFTDPTPADGAILAQNYAFINTSISSSSNTTAFIDWNRSLVGWWRFNNESGENSTFFRDWSSWGNNGTCSGTACPNSTSGKFGNALSFDGVNDYVTIGNPSNGALNFGTGDFSISSWFYMSSLPNAWKTIASKGDSGAVGYGMEISSGNQLTCSIQAIGGTNQHLVSSVPSVGSWHQAVCVFARNDKIYVYLDGIKVTSGTYAANNTNSITNPYQFGIGSHNGNVWFFNGSIDEVQLFSRALSPEEINASFNASSNRLYHNFTNLGSGTYSYKAYAQDLAGNVNQTETRTLTLTSPQAPGSPSITGFAPSSPVTDTPGATREFSITINQTVNVTWYINGSQVSSDSNVLVANYTNISAAIGTWNVSAIASNNNGSAIQTWIWTVAASVPSYPIISFTDPTPANGATLTQNYAYVNTTAQAASTALIDWNRSLVGWWWFNNKLGENSTFFIDWSSWGNNGICSGAACPNSTSGKFGKALSFDGINDYINMGNPSNGALNFETGDFSISSWFYMSSLPNAWKTIVSKGDSGAVGYGMEISSGNQLTCSIQAVGGTNQHIGSAVPSVGSWHQAACVFARNDKIYVYLDGVKVTSGTYAANNTNSVTNPYILGIGSHGGSTWFFNGSIDEVQLFSRALSPEEINASFNAGSNSLYHNFTNLASGTYSYRAYAQDMAGNVNQTETRTLILTPP